jgi:hypothetical protein
MSTQYQSIWRSRLWFLPSLVDWQWASSWLGRQRCLESTAFERWYLWTYKVLDPCEEQGSEDVSAVLPISGFDGSDQTLQDMDFQGAWGPVTATLDWCEVRPIYLFSVPHIDSLNARRITNLRIMSPSWQTLSPTCFPSLSPSTVILRHGARSFPQDTPSVLW